MSEVIRVSDTETVVISTDNPVTVVTGLIGPKGTDGTAASLSSIPDVDTSSLQDGSLLVYSSATQTWYSTNVLQNQVLEAGQY